MLLPTSNNDTSQSLHSTTIAHNSDNGTLALSGIFFMRQSCPVSLTMEPDGCGPRAVFFCSWVICSASSVLLQRLANLPDMGAHHFTGTSRDTPRQCETLFRLLSWQPGVIATHRLAALMAFFFCIFFLFHDFTFWVNKAWRRFPLGSGKTTCNLQSALLSSRCLSWDFWFYWNRWLWSSTCCLGVQGTKVFWIISNKRMNDLPT